MNLYAKLWFASKDTLWLVWQPGLLMAGSDSVSCVWPTSHQCYIRTKVDASFFGYNFSAYLVCSSSVLRKIYIRTKVDAVFYVYGYDASGVHNLGGMLNPYESI